MPFNIGPGELIIVLIIALLVVGPGKLPDVGSALGKSIREFRKAAADVKESTSLETAASAPGTTASQGSSTPPAPAAVQAVTPSSAPVAAAAVTAEKATAPAHADAPAPQEAAAPTQAATDVADAAEPWPAEVTPVDEHPTPSA